MSDSGSYSLPASVVQRAFLRYLPFILVGTLLLYAAGPDYSLRRLLVMLVFLATILALGYGLALCFTWVKLTPEGLVGYSARAPRVHIAWSDRVALRTNTYAGIPCLALYPVSGGEHVVVPRAIARSPEFMAQVAVWAPLAHPLRKVGAHAA